MTLQDIRTRLEQVSKEMTALIREYHLVAESPLSVIDNAKAAITKPADYLRFLELSLEGRILADEGERLMKAERNLNASRVTH